MLYSSKIIEKKLRLYDHHRISKGKKAISLTHCLLIAPESEFPAHQRADQHDQRGLRQVEVGDETVYHVKFIPWVDENIRAP